MDKCKDCKYFLKYDDEENLGRCKRHAPTTEKVYHIFNATKGEYEPNYYHYENIYPEVNKQEEGCGEFKQRKSQIESKQDTATV